MIDIRITADLDSKNRVKLKWACLKGRILCHKTVDRIYATRRGYHLLFDDVRDRSGIPITEKRMFVIRKLMGDDSNRISLDSHTGRLKQVLFNEKTIRFFQNDEETGEHKLVKEETFKRKQIK